MEVKKKEQPIACFLLYIFAFFGAYIMAMKKVVLQGARNRIADAPRLCGRFRPEGFISHSAAYFNLEPGRRIHAGSRLGSELDNED